MSNIKTFISLLFSFKGKIGRIDFLLGHLGALFGVVLSVAVSGGIVSLFYHFFNLDFDPMKPGIMLSVFLAVWSCIALAVKRFRDLGCGNFSAYVMSPITFIPYLNLIFFIPLFLIKGKGIQ